MIYFIEVENGPIKIGHTERKAEDRLKELSASCPYRLNILATMNGDIERERSLHKTYAHWRINGRKEWYQREPLIEFVETINHLR